MAKNVFCESNKIKIKPSAKYFFPTVISITLKRMKLIIYQIKIVIQSERI